MRLKWARHMRLDTIITMTKKIDKDFYFHHALSSTIFGFHPLVHWNFILRLCSKLLLCVLLLTTSCRMNFKDSSSLHYSLLEIALIRFGEETIKCGLCFSTAAVYWDIRHLKWLWFFSCHIIVEVDANPCYLVS